MALYVYTHLYVYVYVYLYVYTDISGLYFNCFSHHVNNFLNKRTGSGPQYTRKIKAAMLDTQPPLL